MTSNFLDPEEEIERVDWVLQLAWWAAGAIAFILAASFLWLQWKNYVNHAVFNSINKTMLIQFALSVYYVSWLFAVRFDLKAQKSVYRVDPKQGRLPWSFFVLTPAFLLVAWFLLWASAHEKYLAIFLSLFFLVDCALWVGMRAWSHPVADATREYRGARPNPYFQIEEINVVDHMMNGQYQIYRHIALLVLIAAFDTLSFSKEWRAYVSGYIGELLGLSQWSIDDKLTAIVLLIYVLACEGSMWFMRARAAISLHILRDLKSRFSLMPREPKVNSAG